MYCHTEVRIINIIKPHYRSEGRRQVSGGVFGGCMALSEDNRDKCHEEWSYIHICRLKVCVSFFFCTFWISLEAFQRVYRQREIVTYKKKEPIVPLLPAVLGGQKKNNVPATIGGKKQKSKDGNPAAYNRLRQLWQNILEVGFFCCCGNRTHSLGFL